jgi:hypothetical protein
MDGGPISILRGVNVHIERVRSTIRTFLMRDIPRGTLSAAAGVSHALSGHSQNELLIPRQSALIRPRERTQTMNLLKAAASRFGKTPQPQSGAGRKLVHRAGRRVVTGAAIASSPFG